MQNLETYQNPFSVLEDYINLSDATEVDFKSIKKQLFLELQLSDDQFIYLKDVPYSKQGITDLFEELEKENYAFHLWVWKDKPLNLFLEKNEITKGFTIAKYKSYFNSDFGELEIKLANALNKYSRTQIRNHKFKTLAELISASNFKQFESKQLAYKRTIDLFQNFINHSNAYNGIQKKSQVNQFQYLKIPSIYKLANLLPAEYTEIREEFALAIVNFTYSFQHTDAIFCRNVLEYARYLNCSENSKKLLVNNFESFNNIRISTNIDKPIHKGYFLIAIAILLVISGFFIKSCNNKESHNDYKNAILENKRLEYSKHLKKPETRDNFIKYHSFFSYELQSPASLILNSPMDNSKFIRYNLDIKKGNRDCSYKFINSLDLDAVICTYDALQIRHYYVKSKDSVDLYASSSLSYFVYFGKEWDSKYKIITFISARAYGMNGMFKEFPESAKAFLQTVINTSGSKDKTKSIEFIKDKTNLITTSNVFIND